MYCYRRWGHNEGDEPAFTQPLMYKAIEHRTTVRAGLSRAAAALGEHHAPTKRTRSPTAATRCSKRNSPRRRAATSSSPRRHPGADYGGGYGSRRGAET